MSNGHKAPFNSSSSSGNNPNLGNYKTYHYKTYHYKTYRYKRISTKLLFTCQKSLENVLQNRNIKHPTEGWCASENLFFPTKCKAISADKINYSCISQSARSFFRQLIGPPLPVMALRPS